MFEVLFITDRRLALAFGSFRNLQAAETFAQLRHEFVVCSDDVIIVHVLTIHPPAYDVGDHGGQPPGLRCRGRVAHRRSR